MTKRIISTILALALAAAFTSCGKSAATDAGSENQDITINIMWQQEVTETFMAYPIEQLKKKYPGIEVNLNISPQAYSEINNLIAVKNAPDIFFTWLSEVDYYGMMQEGLLNSVDSVLAMQTVENDTTLGEKILHAGVEQGAYEGAHYLLPITQYTAMNFYNATFFREHGIEPKMDTLSDFSATCQAVADKTETTPMVYAGVYAFMTMDSFLFPYINNTSPNAVKAINSREEGAWLRPEVVESVQAWADLISAGYVSQDSLAMDHIQSQIEFINNRAAIVPAGTWLEGEMAGQWPDDFELTPFLTPAASGQTQSVVPVIEYMILPKQQDDANLPYVEELVQLFYSQENAQKCLEETGALMAYETVSDDLMALLPPSVQQAQKLSASAEKILPAYKLNNNAQFIESSNLLNALTSGEITAQEFCAQMDALS